MIINIHTLFVLSSISFTSSSLLTFSREALSWKLFRLSLCSLSVRFVRFNDSSNGGISSASDNASSCSDTYINFLYVSSVVQQQFPVEKSLLFLTHNNLHLDHLWQRILSILLVQLHVLLCAICSSCTFNGT